MKFRIEKAIYGGAGLARLADLSGPNGKLAGKAIFVPFTLPGELVEASINTDKRGYATARLETVLEPAAERISPGCEYFGRCGGCHYQQASYQEQLTIKHAILAETLKRAQIENLPDIKIVSAEPWEYRNRVRLVVNAGPPFSLAYREQRSHALTAVNHCPIAAPLLQRAIATLTEAGQGLAALCSEVELFTDGAQTSLMMTLLTSHSKSAGKGALKRLSESLNAALPELVGAALVARSTEHEDGRVVARWGQETLVYTAAGFDYQVSSRAFFQVNRFLADALVEAVTQGRKGVSAWDLYAGVGLFARALASRFEEVTAVESGPSYQDLKHNLPGTKGRAVRATTGDFLADQLRAQAAGPDLIVVDPPRAGLGAQVCELLGKVAAYEVVYVSCDPATLSRDLRALLQSGYSLQSLTLVDLFPQTFHMETVAVLARR